MALTGLVAAVVAAAASPAAAQSLQFEPPLYLGSPEGVPLAGQDGWYVPGGGASAWGVYHNGGSLLGLDPLVTGEGQIAGVALEAPIGGPELIEHSIGPWGAMIVVVDMAVEFDRSLPAGAEIGRVTFEPEGESASLGWVARRDDGGAETWTLDLISYTAEGERRQEPLFEGLEPGVWHELTVSVYLQEIERVQITEMKSWTLRRISPEGHYRAGGAAGGLDLPESLRLSAGAGDAAGAAIVLGVDNLWLDQREPCYADCNRDGRWDVFDFLCFQTRFAAQDPYADCDGSGVIEFFDFLCFQQAWGHCGP